MITVSTIAYVMIQALFYRGLPGHIRGIMISVLLSFGNISLTIYVVVAGVIYDKLGHSSPFTLVSIIDLGVILFFFVLLCFGKLKNL